MSEYTPDKWVIIEIIHNDIPVRKVLASWYGGYSGSDSWRISSGITDIVDCTDHWQVHNESGSVYLCAKNARGMSGYTAGIYKSFAEQATLDDSITVNIIEDERMPDQYSDIVSDGGMDPRN